MTELWVWFQKGGPVMYPLLVCSVVALAIACEKLYALRSLLQVPVSISGQLKSSLLARDYDHLLESCMRSGTPLGRIVATMITQRDLDREDLADLLVEKGREELYVLQKRLALLATLANVSPLLGLLGTVTGMIRLFGVLSTGQTGYESLSQGISEALITTAAGLVIAIPVMLLHRYFTSQIEAIASALEQEGQTAIRLLKPRRHTDPAQDKGNA